MNFYRQYGKRILDLLLLFGALPVFIILSPLFLALIIAMRIESPGPTFFSQYRAGRHRQPFRIYKFRTLVVNDADPLVQPDGPDHVMATRVGRIMRRLKMDELPQLWNVVKGEMSLIGPRPVFMEMVADYTPEEMRRLEVLPGLTGWPQVKGNINLTWDERIWMDVWYVDHLSLWLDLKILFMTAGVVLKGEVVDQAALEEADAYFRSLQQSSVTHSGQEEWAAGAARN